jgi:prepilin-type N-terminal cleavage/methylation domain-containing protein
MRPAFTLIELLVVVTIIVVLLALLTPALDKAVTAAELVKCAANLHAFGVAVPQYALDNRRQLLSPVNVYDGPYPDLVRNFDSQGPGQWSAERMGPYIGGVDLTLRLYSEQWYCPSNGKTDVKDRANSEVAAGGWWCPDYAYFARVGRQFTTFPEDLVQRQLAAGKLLMADTLYYWRGGGTDGWWFNHAETGSSTHDVYWGGPVQSRQAIRGISGTNQLRGDSSVTWKPREKFRPDDMWNPSAQVGWVSQSPGPNPAGDLNFY